MTAAAVRPLPTLPVDPDLPDAGDLLAGGGAAAVARFLAGRGLEPHRIEPAQAHYRPGRWLAVCFRTASVDRVSGAPVSLTVTVDRRAGEPETVWAFPDDPALPGLAPAVDGSVLRRRLRPQPGEVEAEPVRYRPRRRAVVRYRLAGGRVLFGKVVTPRRGRDLLARADALRAVDAGGGPAGARRRGGPPRAGDGPARPAPERRPAPGARAAGGAARRPPPALPPGLRPRVGRPVRPAAGRRLHGAGRRPDRGPAAPRPGLRRRPGGRGHHRPGRGVGPARRVDRARRPLREPGAGRRRAPRAHRPRRPRAGRPAARRGQLQRPPAAARHVRHPGRRRHPRLPGRAAPRPVPPAGRRPGGARLAGGLLPPPAGRGPVPGAPPRMAPAHGRPSRP